MPVNRWVGCGNLTKDAEAERTNGGLDLVKFSIAVNERRKNAQTGEWEDYPNYFDCTMFGKRAVSLERYLTKGTRVAIDGKLRQQRWEKDGQKRSKVGIIVDDIDFMSKPDKQKPKKEPESDYDFYADEDLPF